VSEVDEKQRGAPLVPSEMGDAELARLGWRLPNSIKRHKTAAASGSTDAARKLSATTHLFAMVRAEMDKRQGVSGTITVIDQRSVTQSITPFEAFASVARSVLPCELYGRIAREANTLLGDEATLEECSALLRVRARTGE
jgi:hypothetical protein